MEKTATKSQHERALHRKAEKRVHDLPSYFDQASSEDERRVLLHDIQVHEVELELQNEELARAQAAARESAEKYAELFNFAPVGYFVLSQRGIVREVNLAGIELLGLDAKEIVGHSFEEFVQAEYRSDYAIFCRSVRSTDSKQVCELILQKSGNQWCDVLVEGTVVPDGQDRAHGWRLALIDITARKHAEAALRKAHYGLQQRVEERTADLKEANEKLRTEIEERKRAESLLQSQANHLEKLVEARTAKLQDALGDLEHFSYTITHDMRAPLRAMRGYSNMLLEQNEGLSATNRNFVERINVSAERMDQLILDALNFSKLAREELKLVPIDCAKIIQGIIDATPLLQEPRAKVLIIGKISPVLGNELLLTQCFSNLLNNAVKFVTPGKKPEVRIRAEDISDRVRIWVHDNGIGMSEETQRRIFQLFQRGEPRYEGTGIGLALVRKAAERMGGSVGVESQRNKGSYFWLDLKKAQNSSSN